jgi:hypothetical protein
VYDVDTADVVVLGCLLLLLAWAGILMWRSVNPRRPLLIAASLPALVASALVAIQMTVGGTKLLAFVTIYVCVAAVIVPFAIMMRHELARVLHVVLPIARLVRRGRRS